ncbi:permease [Halodesulfurarchaeum sp.]|uniref:permease n=1 Tax=Halodesulfurarchaeum sp. TaxID=1980530 RepID=UPI001BB931C6|nr:permease [Halodesulfurarchaeum sp.]
MSLTAWIINGFAAIGLLAALYADRERGVRAVKRGLFSFFRILPTVLTIIVIIGLLLGFVPPETIRQFVGDQSGMAGVFLTGTIGSVLHIPSIVAFPLAASFLDMGATISIVAVFVTTLTMIGVVTLPLEVRELGWRFAALRNGLSFLGAILIAVVMGAIL